LVSLFLVALNRYIDHCRDLFGLHWLRRLEEADLFQCTATDETGLGTAALLPGRIGGFTLPQAGIRPEADGRLRIALEGEEPPLWRLVYLDALEAQHTGRYEEAVLLGWSSIELGCRNALPIIARKENVTKEELATTLGITEKKPFLSHEDVIASSGAMNCIETTARFSPSQPYSSASLVTSLQQAYSLRNKVIHRGIRMSALNAKQALDSVGFVLRCIALRFDHKEGPLVVWLSHFGEVHPKLREWSQHSDGRIILYNIQRRRSQSFSKVWDLSVWNREYAVHIPPGLEQQDAATLFLANVLAYGYFLSPNRPALRATATGKQFLVAGLLDGVAHNITRSVELWQSFASLEREGVPAGEASNYLLTDLISTVEGLGESLRPDDIRYLYLALETAALSCYASGEFRSDCAHRIKAANSGLSDEFKWCLEILQGAEPAADHAPCEILKAIHARHLWLDSIVVDCPVESLSFGTRVRPLGQPE
jgi:hypothetical protein